MLRVQEAHVLLQDGSSIGCNNRYTDDRRHVHDASDPTPSGCSGIKYSVTKGYRSMENIAEGSICASVHQARISMMNFYLEQVWSAPFRA